DSGPKWGYSVVREFAWFGGRITRLSLSPDGQRLLTDCAVGDGRVRLWDVATGKMIRDFSTPIPPKSLWFDVAFLPDGKRFLTTGIPEGGLSPTALVLWDADTGKVLHTFKGHTDTVIAVAVTPDGEFAISGG